MEERNSGKGKDDGSFWVIRESSGQVDTGKYIMGYSYK